MRTTWFLIAMLVLAQAVAAGTADDPEVSDPGGDKVSTNPALGASAAELLKGWYEEVGDDVLFHFTSGAMCADSTETVEYRWYATVDGAEVAFGADLFGQGNFCFSGMDDTTITPTGAATAASYTGAQATLTIPRDVFGDDGTIIAATYGTSKAYVGSPTVWNDSDRAPDADGGRDYVLGGIDEAPESLVLNVTDEELRHVLNATAPTTSTTTLLWEGPANTTFTIRQNATGTVAINVTDADGNVKLDCVCGQEASNHTFTAVAGVWNVTIQLTNFTGQLEVAMVPAPAGQTSDDAPEQADDADDSEGAAQEGNATGPDAPSGQPLNEDSPMPLVVAVLALVIAARRK